MRVLFLENTFGFGGSITGLLELIDHLPDVEPVLLASYDVREFVALPQHLDFRWLPMAKQKGSGGGLVGNLARMARYDLFPWFREIRQIHRECPLDLIHGNNSSQTNLAAAIFGRLYGIPAISHQKCFEYEGKLNRLLLQKTWYAKHIATSPSIGEHMLSLGLDPNKCICMFEPIRAPQPSVLERNVANPTPLIGMYSMLTPWKGQDVFLKAIAELREVTDIPFRVVLAGSAPNGDTEYPATLRQLAVDLGIDNLVEFRGHIRDVYPFLSTLDIAVHASVSAEPFGRVVAEAMICGVPVIVSSAGGPSGYVKEGVTGLHATMGEPSALATALRRLLESPELRQRMGALGREFAVREFDPTRLGIEMVELYRELLEERTVGSAVVARA